MSEINLTAKEKTYGEGKDLLSHPFVHVVGCTWGGVETLLWGWFRVVMRVTPGLG